MKIVNTVLLNVGLTSAVTSQATTPRLLSPANLRPESLGLYANFTFGSGTLTTINAWVQTSLDYWNNTGTPTWVDLANFSFTTASGLAYFNLSSLTVVKTQLTTALTNGTLAANTANDGLLGFVYRVLYTSTGTYAGGTTLRIDGIAGY